MSKEFIFELDNALYNEETGEAVFKPKVKGVLVRCKDCKHYDGKWCLLLDMVNSDTGDWFCADGIRK